MGYIIVNSSKSAVPVGCGGVLLSTGALLLVGAMLLASFAFIFWSHNATYSEKTACFVSASAVESLTNSWQPVWNVSFEDRRNMHVECVKDRLLKSMVVLDHGRSGSHNFSWQEKLRPARIYGPTFTKAYRCVENYCIPQREKAERFARTRLIGEIYECYYDPYDTRDVRWQLEPAIDFALGTAAVLTLAIMLMLAGGCIMHQNRVRDPISGDSGSNGLKEVAEMNSIIIAVPKDAL